MLRRRHVRRRVPPVDRVPERIELRSPRATPTRYIRRSGIEKREATRSRVPCALPPGIHLRHINDRGKLGWLRATLAGIAINPTGDYTAI